MPNGIFPIPQFDSHPSRSGGARPGIGLRIRTLWARDRLDDELARGADPAASAELTLRSAQLRSPAVRSRVANAVVETLGDARGPNLGRFTATGQRQQAEIREHADDLVALVTRLRDDQPIDVQGAAMTAQLLNARTSPLYRDAGQNLGDTVRAARLALDHSTPIRQDLASAA